jgi:hypothetical protein
VVSQDRPITIQVSAVNWGSTPVTINSKACPEAFVIRNARGEPVGPPQALCTLEASSEVLDPGETFVFRHTWSGEGLRGASSSPPRRLEPGQYSVEGRVLAQGVGLVEGEPARVSVVD